MPAWTTSPTGWSWTRSVSPRPLRVMHSLRHLIGLRSTRLVISHASRRPHVVRNDGSDLPSIQDGRQRNRLNSELCMPYADICTMRVKSASWRRVRQLRELSRPGRNPGGLPGSSDTDGAAVDNRRRTECRVGSSHSRITQVLCRTRTCQNVEEQAAEQEASEA